MAITSSGFSSDYLESIQGQPVEGTPAEIPAWQRLLAYGIALPTNTLSGLGESAGNIIGLPADPLMSQRMAPPTTGWQGFADVVGGGLAPAAAQLALTGGPSGALLKSLGVAGRSPVIAKAIQEAIQFGTLGAQEDRTTGLEQAAEGGIAGASSVLPRKYRVPVAALLAMGSKAYFDAHHPPEESNVVGNWMGHDWTRGDISALSIAGATMLPGRTPFRPPQAMPDRFAEGPWQGPEQPKMLGYDRPAPDWINNPAQAELPIIEGEFTHATEGGALTQGLGEANPFTYGIQPRPVAPSYTGFGPEELAARTTGPGYPGGPMVPDILSPSEHNFYYRASMGMPEVPAQSMQQLLNRTPFPLPAAPGAIATGATTPDVLAMSGQARVMPVQSSMTIPGQARGGVPWRELFDPADADWLHQKLGADIDNPEIQNALISLRMGISRAMVASDKREAQLAFMKFFEDIGHQPDVTSLTPPQGEEAWADIVKMGKASQAVNAPMVSNPLPEGDPLTMGMPRSKTMLSLPELNAAQAAEASAAEAKSEAQREAARRGKIPDLPEYRRTEGGVTNLDTLLSIAYAGARGTVGGLIGAQTGDTPEDRMLHAAIAAGLFTGLPYAWKLIPLLQRLERNEGVADMRGHGTPNYRSTVNPAEGRRGVPVSDESLHQMQSTTPLTENYLEAQKETARRGKMQSMPEYLRTQGGGVANPFFGSQFADNSNRTDALHSSQLETKNSAKLRVAALTPEGKLLTGKLGEIHASLDAPLNSEMGFVDQAGKFLNREEARLVTNEPIGQSNLDATTQKNINDAKMMSPKDPEGFLQKMADMSRSQGKEEAAINFEKARDALKGGRAEAINIGTKLFSGIMPEMSAAMNRALIGGAVGATVGSMTDDLNEHSGMLIGASIGALALGAGPTFARGAIKALLEMRLQPKGKGGTFTSFAKSFSTKLEDATGATFKGSNRVTDRFLRALDSGLGLTMPTQLKNILLQAKGAGSVLLDQIDSALLNVSLRYSPSEEIKKLTNLYFDGQFGVGQAGGEAYMKAMAPHIALDAKHLSYANFAVAARTAVDGLQHMVAEGIGDIKNRRIINDSIGKYLTRSYKLFTDSRYQPSDESIHKLAEYLAGETKANSTEPLMGTQNVDQIKNGLHQYIREVKATKGVYVASSPIGQSIDQGLFNKRIVQLDKAGKPLIDANGQPILAMRQEWRDFYGEITDPTQRIYQTVFRLRPMAEASKYFADIADSSVDGVPQAFNKRSDLDVFRNKLKQDFADAGTEADRAVIQRKISSLESYQYIDPLSKFGDLQGKVVSRHVWDTLKTYDSMTDASSGWLRSIANAHTMIKLSRTALSPITVLRNIFTAPMFLAIGRGNVNDLSTAWDIIHDPKHKLRAEIMRMGIGNVDQVKTEFHKEFENLTGSKYNFGQIDLANLGMGQIDLDLGEKVIRRGFRNVLDFYRLPDNMVRIGTYLSAKARIAESMGLALDHPEVLERALNFTNRYTMNYDALPPLIKKMRNVPFFNLFLSYTAELARIGKNVTEDVIKGGDGINTHGRMYAMMLLGTLTALPETLEWSSEDSLPQKDKEEWQKMKKIMPDYGRTRYRFVTGKDPKTGMFNFYDFTPLIASDAYNQMGRAIKARDWRALAQINPFIGLQNTPVLNIVAKQAMGEDFHRQFRPLGYGGWSDRFASAANEVTPPLPIFPWTNEGQKWRLAYSTNAQGESGLTNSKTGVRITPMDVWMPYFSGIRPGSMNGAVLMKSYEAQAKQDVANEIAYANDLLKQNLPPQRRAEMIERTNKAISAIQARYLEQLGVNADRKSSANSGEALLHQ